jgi:hypothetical protein
MNVSERHAIASRLRSLMAPALTSGVSPLAKMLGVEEQSLRNAIDATVPIQTVDFLLAVIRYYGLDPTWLLTGVYDHATHLRFAAAEEERRPEAMRRLVTRLTTHHLEWPVFAAWDHGDGSELAS